VIVINLWWSRSDSTFIPEGMGMATIFSFVLGYLLISSLNIGLTYEISQSIRDKRHLIGIFYQRTLLVNFLFCVFVITPVLYLSKNVVKIFRSVDHIRNYYAYEQIADTVGNYLYQLVPSIYAFAFYDTTQSFLLAQGHILAPMVIQVVAIVAHLLLIHQLGPAWSKNTIDFLSAVAIYAYIMTLREPLESWIEWTIKCVKGWGNYLKFLEIICFTTYLQGLFFFFFCCLGYRLEREELSCHIFYINIYQVLYLLYIGIKEGALIKLGHHIKNNQYEQFRKDGVRSIRLFVLISSLFILFLYIYEQEICDFFFQQKAHAEVFKKDFYLLAITVVIDSFHMGLASLLKALNRSISVLSNPRPTQSPTSSFSRSR
jgi:Na+-driven multidrug efflux pump